MIEAVKHWNNWEYVLLKLNPPDYTFQTTPTPVAAAISKTGTSPEEKQEILQSALPITRLENHYSLNKFFFPSDDFLLKEENIQRIAHIPTVIVQGRYDIICPAISAYQLHQKLPQSQLIVPVAGHSASDEGIRRELVRAAERFKSNR